MLNTTLKCHGEIITVASDLHTLDQQRKIQVHFRQFWFLKDPNFRFFFAQLQRYVLKIAFTLIFNKIKNIIFVKILLQAIFTSVTRIFCFFVFESGHFWHTESIARSRDVFSVYLTLFFDRKIEILLLLFRMLSNFIEKP